MSTQVDELLSRCLADMLRCLRQGEAREPKALAEHYWTSLRSFYRDLNERFANLPAHKVDQDYRLDASYLRSLDFKHIANFIATSGVTAMISSIDLDFLRQLTKNLFFITLKLDGQFIKDFTISVRWDDVFDYFGFEGA